MKTTRRSPMKKIKEEVLEALPIPLQHIASQIANDENGNNLLNMIKKIFKDYPGKINFNS